MCEGTRAAQRAEYSELIGKPVNDDGLALDIKIEVHDPEGGEADQVAEDLMALIQSYMNEQNGTPDRTVGVEVVEIIEFGCAR